MESERIVRNMLRKRKLGALCFIIVITLMLAVGCSLNNVNKDTSSEVLQEEKQKENKLFWEQSVPKGTTAVIINKLNDEEYKSFKSITKLYLDDSKEKILLVAAVDGLDIEVWSVEYDGSKLVNKELKFEKKNTEKNFALDLQCYRPEGIPVYKIKVSSSEGSLEYPISFRDGKDGPKDIEYLTYGME